MSFHIDKFNKESIYYQGSLTEIQSRQIQEINADETFFSAHKSKPKTQSYYDTSEFDSIMERFPFFTNKILYRKIIEDSRVLPYDHMFANRIDQEYTTTMYENFLNIYKNSPMFFDKLFGEEGKKSRLYVRYQLYIYLLQMLDYIITHYDSEEFKGLFRDHELYHNWALNKYSPQIKYLLIGPLSKSSAIRLDFQKHYNHLMSSSNVEGDLTQNLQLETLHNLDVKTYDINANLLRRANVFEKTPDYAKSYTIILHSKNIDSKYLDENKNLIFDLNTVDFGDTTNDNLPATLENMTEIRTSGVVTSRLAIKKLQEIFNQYSRFKVFKLLIYKKMFRTDLTTLKNVCLNFEGIQLSERNVYVNEDVARLRVYGSCKSFDDYFYEFTPNNEFLCYRPQRAQVKNCYIYLTNGNSAISAYEPSFSVPYINVYNYPIEVNETTEANYLQLFNLYIYNFVNNSMTLKESFIYNPILRRIGISTTTSASSSYSFAEYSLIDIQLYELDGGEFSPVASVFLSASDDYALLGKQLFTYIYHYDTTKTSDNLTLINRFLFDSETDIAGGWSIYDFFMSVYFIYLGENYDVPFIKLPIYGDEKVTANVSSGNYVFRVSGGEITQINDRESDNLQLLFQSYIRDKDFTACSSGDYYEVAKVSYPYSIHYNNEDENYNYNFDPSRDNLYKKNEQRQMMLLNYNLFTMNEIIMVLIYNDTNYGIINNFKIYFNSDSEGNISGLYLSVDNHNLTLSEGDNIRLYTSRKIGQHDYATGTDFNENLAYNRIRYRIDAIKSGYYIINVALMGGFMYSDSVEYNNIFYKLAFQRYSQIFTLSPIYGENYFNSYINTTYPVRFLYNSLDIIKNDSHMVIYFDDNEAMNAEAFTIKQDDGNLIIENTEAQHIVNNYYVFNELRHKIGYLYGKTIEISYYNINEIILTLEFT